MSTSALIGIEGHSIFAYKHEDGYPDGEHGVLAFLKPFTEEFCKYRDLTESVRAFIAIMIRHQTAWLLNKGCTIGGVTHSGTPEKYRGYDFFSWSLHHVDDLPYAEYIYIVTKNGDIAIYKNAEFSHIKGVEPLKVIARGTHELGE